MKKGTVPFFYFFTIAVIRKRVKTRKKGDFPLFMIDFYLIHI